MSRSFNPNEAVLNQEHEHHTGTVKASVEIRNVDEYRFEGDDDDLGVPNADELDTDEPSGDDETEVAAPSFFATQEQDRIYDLLVDHVGKENAITSGEIADRCGIDDSSGNPRTRRHIRELIEQGVAVGSSTSVGYYITNTKAEADENLKTFNSRIKSMEERAEHYYRALQTPTTTTTSSTAQ